jgi:broad specificity phosphatase PhoE
VRHGDRYNPEWVEKVGKALERSGDIPLSHAGHRQAQDLGAFLRDRGVRTIISSPYLRCLQTASEVAKETGTRILVENGLAEGPGHQVGLSCAAAICRLRIITPILTAWCTLAGWMAA